MYKKNQDLFTKVSNTVENKKQVLTCFSNCCKLYVIKCKENVWLSKQEWDYLQRCKYNQCNENDEEHEDWTTQTVNNKITKAGTFIFDSKQQKVLLIQVKGGYWGCPKGTIERNELPKNCAIRETYEETGIELEEYKLGKKNKIKNCFYYDVELSENNTLFKLNVDELNDTNGIGWIKTKCLEKLVSNGIININKHLKIILDKKFN